LMFKAYYFFLILSNDFRSLAKATLL